MLLICRKMKEYQTEATERSEYNFFFAYAAFHFWNLRSSLRDKFVGRAAGEAFMSRNFNGFQQRLLASVVSLSKAKAYRKFYPRIV